MKQDCCTFDSDARSDGSRTWIRQNVYLVTVCACLLMEYFPFIFKKTEGDKRHNSKRIYKTYVLQQLSTRNSFILVYFTTLSLPRLYSVERLNNWWIINRKLFEKKRSWPNRASIPSLTSKDWGKSRTPSAKVAGIPADIRNEDLPNTSLPHYHCTSLLRLVLLLLAVLHRQLVWTGHRKSATNKIWVGLTLGKEGTLTFKRLR
jgi:hypothetical protein